MERTEVLIVGQGLAGSVLAHQLRKNGVEFRVVDQESGANCSRVAGGMMNPISPRIPTKAWRAGTLFPEAEQFYRKLEEESGRKLLHSLPILRPYSKKEEKERWEKNAVEKGFEKFLLDPPPIPQEVLNMDPELGVAAFQGAFLDIPAFLDCSAGLLEKEERLIRKRFEPETLRKKEGGWEWEGLRFGTLVLCQGTGISGCPFFGSLPMRSNKGEILTLEAPAFPRNFILNKGIYAIPQGEKKVRVGATYDHTDTTPEPTEKMKEKLLSDFEAQVRLPYRLLEHQAGFRATTPDTRPYVGFHPEEKGVAVFNGFGSKGVSLAPYWAKRLLEIRAEGKAITPDPEVAPGRFDR